MISALMKAFEQLSDPRIQKVVWKCLFYSLAIFAAVVAAVWALLDHTTIFDIGWLEGVIDFLGIFAAVVISLLLFPSVALVVVGFMLEEIADAVEDRYYPGLPEGRKQHIAEAVWISVRLAAFGVVLNLLALVVYVIPIIGIVLFPFVFYALNGILLGREYFELVALRRLEPRVARDVRQRRKGRLFVGGVVITFILSIPFIGWFMPVVAAAFMVHVYHSLHAESASAA